VDTVDEVLSSVPILSNPCKLGLSAAVAQGRRIILDLGRLHSVEASRAAFNWLRLKTTGVVSAAWFEACITACAYSSDFGGALDLLRDFKQSGFEGTIRMWNMLITACCNGGRLSEAVEVLDFPVCGDL
jgi:hypothetical protein